jgi:hypothetical protein
VAWAEQPRAVAVLEKRCLACHTGQNKKSGLDLSTRDLAIRGGDRGPAIVPGNSKESLLLKVANHSAEPHMPYKAGRLADSELAAIAEWIDQGAAYEPRDVSAKTDRGAPLPDHWAFRVPKRPPVPKTANEDWVRNPIDAFISAEHAKRKLVPAPEVDKRTLLRRAYLDLIGVPPTREEISKFLADASSKAYEAVVDSLLADPRYGERWGRHWMDVWRYSDWYGWRKGNDVRNSHKFVWRWRDWIVESLNNDKGYDRMIVEMLAGDEIAPNDPDTIRATGFLVRNYSKYDRNGWLQDAVDHTAMGLLGITVKCARCHDHKYDPIAQEEYYRFRAIFEPYEVRVDRVEGEVDTDKNGLSRIYDAETDRPTYLYVRGDIQNPDKEKALPPGVPRLFGSALGKIDPVSLPLDSYYPDHRGFVHTDLVAKAKADIERAEADLRKKEEQYESVRKDLANVSANAGYDMLRAVSDQLDLARKTVAAAKEYLPALEARITADRAKFAEPPDFEYENLAAAARKAERKAGILKADENVFRAQLEFNEALRANGADEKKVGEAQKKLAAAQQALTQADRGGYTSIGKVYLNKSTGRRTALANWIASPDNPLTARVAVNHIWLRHFGKPLVPTVFDFGLNGKPPSHPELLDWLATEFVNSGWNMKAIHRLMVTSTTYRMRSTAGESASSNTAVDSENRFLWRMNPRRMEAEVVRDSMLQLAGQLDREIGGPEIDETRGFESHRRSIYFSHSPDTRMEFLKMFDVASPSECYVRNESVVPQQALALANSQLSQAQARVIAKNIGSEVAPAAFVKMAFETVLGRLPSAKEQAIGERFLERQPELLASLKVSVPTGSRARENFVHVLLNHNDFVTIR